MSHYSEVETRGVQDIFIACVDGLKGFPESIETVFPRAQVQLCLVHVVRNSLKYVSWKQRKEVAADLKAIYQAPTDEQAEMNLTDFEAKWDESHPTIGQSWRRNWERSRPFSAYSPEISEVIYTTNAIESMNMSLRKVTKNRGSFPNDESMLKLSYLPYFFIGLLAKDNLSHGKPSGKRAEREALHAGCYIFLHFDLGSCHIQRHQLIIDENVG